MATGTPNRGAITARLDALRFELRSEIAGVRTDLASMEGRLGEKIAKLALDVEHKIGGVNDRIGTLSQDFKEFKGTAKGVAVVLTVLVPAFTAVTVFGGNLLLRQMGLASP